MKEERRITEEYTMHPDTTLFIAGAVLLCCAPVIYFVFDGAHSTTAYAASIFLAAVALGVLIYHFIGYGNVRVGHGTIRFKGKVYDLSRLQDVRFGSGEEDDTDPESAMKEATLVFDDGTCLHIDSDYSGYHPFLSSLLAYRQTEGQKAKA